MLDSTVSTSSKGVAASTCAAAAVLTLPLPHPHVENKLYNLLVWKTRKKSCSHMCFVTGRLPLLWLAASFQNCGKLWISDFLKNLSRLALKEDSMVQEIGVACLPRCSCISYSVLGVLGNGKSPLDPPNFGSFLRTENVRCSNCQKVKLERHVGVKQCNHCYFWRKACHKKACYTSHLTERTACVVSRPSSPLPFLLYRAEFTVKESPECWAGTFVF